MLAPGILQGRQTSAEEPRQDGQTDRTEERRLRVFAKEKHHLSGRGPGTPAAPGPREPEEIRSDLPFLSITNPLYFYRCPSLRYLRRRDCRVLFYTDNNKEVTNLRRNSDKLPTHQKFSNFYDLRNAGPWKSQKPTNPNRLERLIHSSTAIFVDITMY